MFSKACEYGIRAVILIAANSRNGKRTGIKELCEEIEVPKYFTAKILQNLVRKKLIHSVKGPNGGFYVENDREIKLIDIVIAIDGDELFTGCGLGIQECSEEKPCPIHNQFKVLRSSLQQMLASSSVAHITDNLEKGTAFLKK